MSKNITRYTLLLLLNLIYAGANAQQWLGRTTGNYTGTYGIYNNASSLADNKYKYYFNFWGRGVNFYNDYLSYNAPVKLNHWANNSLQLNAYKDINGKIQMGDDWLIENLDGKSKQFSFNQDIFGPAFMFPVSKNWNMSINTRQRSGLQMLGISEAAAKMAKNGISNGQFASIDKKFSVNIQSYQELSFTLGGIMTRNDKHVLSGGATLKLIRGLGAAYLKGSQLNIQATGNNSALVSGDFQYAYTDDKAAIAPFNDPYGLFSLQSRGAGAGFDLGLTYTYRSDRLKYRNKLKCDRNDLRSDHDIKLSVAFNDIGGIRYNRRSTEYSYSSQAGTAVSAGSDILNGFGIASQNGFDSIGRNVFGAMGATSSSGFNTSLPAAFNFQADFRFSKSFYTSIYLNQSLKGMKTTGLRATSMLSIIPRFESRGFEFSMPLTLGENYKNFYLGAYARIGPVFFGSDNLGGLLNVASGSEFRGADIYGGISFGIGHCHSWWYNDNVDPVYMDSTKTDTLKTELRDTINEIKKDTIVLKDTVKIIKRDTVYIDKKSKEVIKRDTVYIEKNVKSTAVIEKEKEIKRRELELNKRKAELDAKELELLKKEKIPVNETEALKDCNEKTTELQKENTTLKNKVNTQAEEILQLKKQLDDLNKKVPVYELEKQKCNDEKVKTNAEIIRLQGEIIKANKRIAELEEEVNILKKAAAAKNNAEVVKGSDAEKLAKANKQVDSLKLVILYLQSDIEKCKKNSAMNNAEILKKAETEKAKAENDAKIVRKEADSLKTILAQRNQELENCKKNSTMNSAEIVKKAEADKAKAENDARIAKKQADSLAAILAQRNLELENCKKNSTMNNAENVKKAEADKAKAENEARVAKKQADSLGLVLAQRTLELENCKKGSDQNDAEVQKLKKCEDENAMLKLEMADMSKTIGKLNTKNYALSLKVDSLINELKNCCKNCSTGSSNNDAELLKKCQDSKLELDAEIIRLKSVISKKDKSLDSMEAVVSTQAARQVELNAQISKLNTEISDLKSKGSSNCDDIQKQLDDKNAELNKVKNENTVLNNQVKNLTNQLNEYKTEYNFMVKQNQKCSMQLDSCVRGLHKTEPSGGETPDGKGGPHEGSFESSDSSSVSLNRNDNDDVYTAPSKPNRGVRTGVSILGAILNAALEASTETNSGSGTSSGGNSGNSNSGGKKPTEKKSGSSGSTSGNNSGSGSGNNGSSGSVNNGSSGSGGNTNTGGTNNNGGSSGSSGNNGSSSTGGNNGGSSTNSGSSGSRNNSGTAGSGSSSSNKRPSATGNNTGGSGAGNSSGSSNAGAGNTTDPGAKNR